MNLEPCSHWGVGAQAPGFQPSPLAALGQQGLGAVWACHCSLASRPVSGVSWSSLRWHSMPPTDEATPAALNVLFAKNHLQAGKQMWKTKKKRWRYEVRCDINDPFEAALQPSCGDGGGSGQQAAPGNRAAGWGCTLLVATASIGRWRSKPDCSGST